VQQYIGFRLHTGEYAIPITRVREIVNLPMVTSLPQSPAYLRGVTNLRGNVIPLVNLRKLINIAENGNGGGKVIVIVSGRLTFGIIVDGITGVLSIDENAIESPEGLSHAHSQEITGVAKLDGRLIVLLDTGKLIPLKDRSLLEEVLAEVRDTGKDGTVEVTKTVQGMAGEIKVKELHDAREYFEKNKKISADDPKGEVFEEIVSFMNAISNHDYEKADLIIQAVTKKGQGDLFQEVGKITRKLHDTIKSFKEALDPKIKDFAQADIPSAVDRLQFVIDKTEEAANKTMSVVEKYVLRMDELSAHIRKVEGPPETVAYLKEFKNTLEDDFTEIITTQSFQDLTGQTIKKVITLVGDIETELVRLVASFGVKLESGSNASEIAPEKVSQAGVDDLLKEFGF
jgi:chemotaxis signal transduction protein/chemotaxis regulatin CheY-phosphate phosphatase CheZ